MEWNEMLNSVILLIIMASLGCQNVWSAPCLEIEVSPCVDTISSLSITDDVANMDKSHLEEVCKVADAFLKCLDDLTCEMPNGIGDQREQMASTCSAGGCSSLDLVSCTDPLSSSVSDGVQNMEKMCRLLPNVMKCLSDMLPKCKDGDVTARVNSMLTPLTEMSAACKADCSVMDMQKCGEGLEDMDNDPTKVCKKINTARKCFNEMRPKCIGEMKTQVDTALKQFESMSDECCDAMQKIYTDCYPKVNDHENNFDALNKTQCTDNALGLSCLKKYVTKCDANTGAMKQMDGAARNMTERMDNCEENGYRSASSSAAVWLWPVASCLLMVVDMLA